MRFYLIARTGIRLAGHRYAFVALAVILLYQNTAHGHPMEALPSLTFWYLILAGVRMLGRALPVPTTRSRVPKDAPLPPPAIAVSIAPTVPAEACPDFQTMAGRLAPNVARLIR